MWNVDQYQKFSNERSRPFFDLLQQVPKEEVGTIVDLGCGAGNLTRVLADRWPKASVIGLDSSPEMLEQAHRQEIPDRLCFSRSDIADWSSEKPVDLLISNAALQWVAGHDALLSRLADSLSPNGVLAVQMPYRFGTASQKAIEETCRDPRWQSQLAGVGLRRDSVQPLAWYVKTLHQLGFSVNAWETTYYHCLRGENAVLEWLKGTALTPILELLDPKFRRVFLDDLAPRLQSEYPRERGVTLFPFPRIFFVATRLDENTTLTNPNGAASPG